MRITTPKLRWFCKSVPEQVAAEYEAKHEDEETNA